MADNYFQATVEPLIPAKYVSDELLELLGFHGFDVEKETGNDGEVYYYFYSEAYADLDEVSSIFQEILDKIPESEMQHITLEGSYSCSKMRPGEFGGVAAFIRRNRVATMNTGEWLGHQISKKW